MVDFKMFIHRRQRGISLLEVLLALAIVAAVTIYLTRMIGLVESGNKVEQSLDRMKQIGRQAKTYYLSHETLPDPSTTPAQGVPVDNQQLNLTQKYRFDAWGQYFLYFKATTLDAIVGFKVNGRDAAGVLISLGPNQTKDYDDSSPDVYIGRGDDLLFPITLEEEAWQIAMDELVALDKRVIAYDQLFAGIDNGGDHIYERPTAAMPDPSYSYGGDPPLDSFYLVDEDGCDRAQGGVGWLNSCLYRGTNPSSPATRLTNDPNCGRATLDDCDSTWGGSVVLESLLELYGIEDPGYQTDPWGHLYQWGNGSDIMPTDRRYHVFYSMGPDGQTNVDETHPDSLDDITPY